MRALSSCSYSFQPWPPPRQQIFLLILQYCLVAQLVKNRPARQDTLVPPLGLPGSGRSPGEGIGYPLQYSWASLVAQTVKNPPATQEDLGLIPGLGRSPGGGHGSPLQYYWLKNPHRQRSLVGSMWSQRVRPNWATKHTLSVNF